MLTASIATQNMTTAILLQGRDEPSTRGGARRRPTSAGWGRRQPVAPPGVLGDQRATGGQFSGGMLSSPTSPAERSSESIKLPKGGGSVIANRFRWFFSSGQASRTSEAGFSSCHRASIAAIFAGWW